MKKRTRKEAKNRQMNRKTYVNKQTDTKINRQRTNNETNK
jgi:tRNA A-37 threonylcarbamoyl transferase component Bud32